MPAIKAASVDPSNIDVIDLGDKLIRIRKNLIDGLTPAVVESKFNLWVSANLDTEVWTAYLHCYSVSPFVVALRIQNKSEPAPPAVWWGENNP